MDCQRALNCIFFNDHMTAMPEVAELLKTQYCRGTFDRCARFRVATKLGGANVPCDLFPNNSARAERILASS